MNPSPAQVKAAFENSGYHVVTDDDGSWILATSEDDDPLLLPKHGACVADDILEYAMDHALANGKAHAIARILGIAAPKPRRPPAASQPPTVN